MEKDQYIIEMQVARGIGILLVTLGHSEPIKTTFPSIFNIIYSFHMPLFFFLSGFFSTKSMQIESLREWFKVVPSRLLSLIIPYIVISLAYSLLKYFVSDLAIRPVVPQELFFDIFVFPNRNPALFLWFLYTIIIIRAISPLLLKSSRYLVLALLILLQNVNPNTEAFGIGLLFHYTIYYYLGQQASLIKFHFLSLLRKKTFFVISLLLFVCGYIFLKDVKIVLFTFILAICGIALVLSFCFCYIQILPTNFIEIIGRHSLQIYLLQYFFIFPLYFLLIKSSVPNTWIVPCTFFTGLTAPLLLAIYVFPKSKTFSFLLGGSGLRFKTHK